MMSRYELTFLIGLIACVLCVASLCLGIVTSVRGKYKLAAINAACAVANAGLAYFEFFIRWRS